MIHDGASFPNLAHTPQIQYRAVNQCDTSDNGERPRRSERQTVAKVEKRSGDTAD
jgi:hypothetical protein